MKPLRVLHLITNLNVGGAQTMLVKLLEQADTSRIQSGVVTLQDLGPMHKLLQQMQLPTESLDMHSLVSLPNAVYRFGRIARDWKPDVIQTWMYHSNLVGSLAAKTIARTTPVVWNIRMNPPLPRVDKRTTHWVGKFCGKNTRQLADGVVLNSHVSLNGHADIGYPRELMHVLYNGFDCNKLDRVPAARPVWRDAWDVKDDDLVVGTVGRFHPHKDYKNFVDAASIIAAQVPTVRFVMCGNQLSADNETLMDWIRKAELSDRFHLLGRQNDVAGVLSAFDLSVSSSLLEGFPNSVGEAMACRVPCVVTNAGGTAELVGNAARIVSCRSPQQLADECLGVLRLSTEQRREMGNAGRQRIVDNFGLDRIAHQYETLWRTVSNAHEVPHQGLNQKAA